MSDDDQNSDRDCGTGFSSGTPRRVTKPKLFDEAMHVRLPAGTKARIDALRGDMRQGDFVRLILLKALESAEEGQSFVVGKAGKSRDKP